MSRAGAPLDAAPPFGRQWRRLGRRWRYSLLHELRFWAEWQRKPAYRYIDLRRFWDEEIQRCGMAEAKAEGKVVIEVGAGPAGLIYHMTGEGLGVGLDPLLPLYCERAIPRSRVYLGAAWGELLPLRRGIADWVVCYNVLDHTISPSRVLAEIARILRPGGRLLLVVNTFRWGLRLLRVVDEPHLHHWRCRDVLALLRGLPLRPLEQTEVRRRLFDAGSYSPIDPRGWRYRLGNAIVYTLYLSAEKEA